MLPEERVRRAYIEKLINEGYPPDLIVVEKKLSELPHLSFEERAATPNRRIDILLYAKDAVGLRPYLLVECKAVTLRSSMRRQLIGYNYYIKAPFIALISQNQELIASWDDYLKEYIWQHISHGGGSISSSSSVDPKTFKGYKW